MTQPPAAVEVERGIRNPTVLVLQEISMVLKIEPADLLVKTTSTARTAKSAQ